MRLGDFITDHPLALRAEVLAQRLLYGLDQTGSLGDPFGARFGVIGVGLRCREAEPAVVVIVLDAMTSGEIFVPAFQRPQAASALAAVTLPGELWDKDEVYAWGLPGVTPQVNPGDAVRGTGKGTAGAPVHWTSGGSRVDGILTAGHVVTTATSVTSGGTSHNVAACRLPASGGMDVAAIELGSPSPAGPLSAAVALTGRANIELHKSTMVADPVVAKFGWFQKYLDLYMTLNVISVGGDSGSVAVVQGTSEFVGTLIGASSGSLIQDGRTQLSALGATLSGITI